MNKEEFLLNLENAVSGLPKEDIAERIEFYSEIIDDRIEEGMSEEDAVSAIGTVDEVKAQILSDIPFPKIIKEKLKPRRKLGALEIVLLVLGFPLWLPLLISFCVIIISLYIVILSLIVTLWAIDFSFIVSALAGIALSVFFFWKQDIMSGILVLGFSLFTAGVSIFTFYGCLAATKGIVKLTKKALVGIKSMFVGKENIK